MAATSVDRAKPLRQPNFFIAVPFEDFCCSGESRENFPTRTGILEFDPVWNN
jgi:hypothetical protein